MNTVIFAGLGQYGKAIQNIFETLSLLKNLIGGWFDLEQNKLIIEKVVILKNTTFNRALCKILLRKEKCFLVSNGYHFGTRGTKEGFTKFAENNTYIIPNTLNFVKF